MRFVLFLLLSLLPLLSAQYACPLIAYTQAVTPSSYPLLPSSPSFSLSFINESPNLPLSFLDVHYAINGADPTNLRLSPSSSSPAPSSPPFILQSSDELDYSFTYQVQGLDLACDTHHFHVSGRELQAHGEDAHHTSSLPSESAPIPASTPAPAPAPGPTPSIQTAERVVLQPLHATNAPIIVLPMGADRAATEHSAASEEAIHSTYAAAPAREAEVLDLNLGVCPLIPFKQELRRRAEGKGEFALAFSNLSPSVALEFLDVHLAINRGPTSNLRLYTDATEREKASNEERALEGLMMSDGDVIQYSFTYGVKGGASEEAEGLKGKVRACNTEVFSKTVVDK